MRAIFRTKGGERAQTTAKTITLLVAKAYNRHLNLLNFAIERTTIAQNEYKMYLKNQQ
jgi:hypothetical protein